jgi:hypothetical protein
VVHSLHDGCPYAGLNRIAETAHAAFERCRLTLHEQLGTVPSPSTRAAHSELLR